MNRRIVVTGLAAAAVLGTVVPSLAASPAQSSPVGVQVTTTNGVFVGVDVLGRPAAGAGTTAEGVCVGVSEQVPQCVPVTIQGPPKPAASRRALPVVVYHDANETAVGAGDVGVIVYSNGRICPVVSTQDWQCL
jgi:hypothetical protein